METWKKLKCTSPRERRQPGTQPCGILEKTELWSSKRSGVVREWGALTPRGTENPGAVDIPCAALSNSGKTCHFTFAQTPSMYTPKSEPRCKPGTWVITTRRCRFLSGNE